MEDSIEDYLKLSKNSKQDEAVKISKEAQRKKDCEIRAVKIVEFCIEGKLRPEIFIRSLPFISQSHYQDIVEERAITKLCGYAICGKKIPEMPQKQYFISTKSNRVYDITDRKNYCSNFCYKASVHVKNQVEDSPLWLRKFEEFPRFQLLNSAEGGLPGEFIDPGIAKPAPMETKTFTPVSIFTEASLTDLVEWEINPDKQKSNSQNSYKKSSARKRKSTMQTISENAEQAEEEMLEQVSNRVSNNKIRSNKPIVEAKQVKAVKILPAIDENEERLDPKPDEITNVLLVKVKKIKTNKTPTKIDVESLVKKSLAEWLTLESYIYIYGEKTVKNILSEKKLSNYFDSLHITTLERTQQKKYMDICKRLQLQEMADDKFDNTLISGTNSTLQLPPDYKKLKDQGKELDLKVKSFYGGVLHEKADPNFPVADEGGEAPPAVLPMVDGTSQNALRRRIFLNSINKSMQQLLQSLHLPDFSLVLLDLQAFVKTFKLKADNIVFRPNIWNYISLILLYILSLRFKNIQEVLEEKRSQEYIALTLSALPNKNNFINEIMTNFQNIDLFIETYITKKCD